MKRIFYVACAVLLCACVGRADRNRAGATDPMKADGGLVYDVKNFGAVGDGVTDDTRAIPVLPWIMRWIRGGTVYFPNGLYRLATLQDTCKVRAHLIVKPRQSPGRRDYVMIRLQGESSVVTPCSYASHTTEDKAEVWKNGTVLVSDAVGELQTDPAQVPVSVLAAGAGDNLYLLNQAVVRLQDLAFQVKAEAGKYPYLSGVNMAYAATVYTDNILIYSSIRNMALTSPTGDGTIRPDSSLRAPGAIRSRNSGISVSKAPSGSASSFPNMRTETTCRRGTATTLSSFREWIIPPGSVGSTPRIARTSFRR